MTQPMISSALYALIKSPSGRIAIPHPEKNESISINQRGRLAYLLTWPKRWVNTPTFELRAGWTNGAVYLRNDCDGSMAHHYALCIDAAWGKFAAYDMNGKEVRITSQPNGDVSYYQVA